MNYNFRGYPVTSLLGDDYTGVSLSTDILSNLPYRQWVVDASYIYGLKDTANNWKNAADWKASTFNTLINRFDNVYTTPIYNIASDKSGFLGATKHYHATVVVNRGVWYVPVKNYYSTLDVITDPTEYIRTLMYAESTGLSFESAIPLGPNGLLIKPRGYDPALKATYDLYVNRFADVYYTWIIREAIAQLSIASTFDEASVQAQLITALNATLHKAQAAVNGMGYVRLIPRTESYEFYTASREWGSFQLPASTTIFTYTVSLQPYVKAILNGIIQKASVILKAQTVKLAAQLNKLQDADAKLTEADIAYLNDPTRNPFLAPATIQAGPEGQAQYVHLEKNQILQYKNFYPVINTTLGPAPKYISTALKTIDYYTKNIPIVGGGTASQYEIDKLGSQSGSITPLLVLGGIAVAFAATQIG